MNELNKLKISRKFLQAEWQQIIGQDIKHRNKTTLQENLVELHYHQRQEEMAGLWK